MIQSLAQIDRFATDPEYTETDAPPNPYTPGAAELNAEFSDLTRHFAHAMRP